MAHEYMLKMLVDSLENAAKDFETFANLLNHRAKQYGTKTLFEPAQYQPPEPKHQPPNPPRYPSREESASRAAESANRIADNYELVIAYFRIPSNPPELLNPELYGEEELLHLILSWQILSAGAFKSILNLYGERPAPLWPLSHPGAASELRLWAETAGWLEKIATDSTLFSVSQHLSPSGKSRSKKTRPGTIIDSLVRLEQALHRTTAGSLLVAGALPYHLHRTAHRK
jgi:hypothetical protein